MPTGNRGISKTKLGEALGEEITKQLINRVSVKHSKNPILSEGGYGVYGYEHPSVIKVNGSYYMFVASHPTIVGARRRISLATSPDGVTWTLYNNGKPILDVGGVGAWDEFDVTDPFVFYNLSAREYWMYYSGATEPRPTRVHIGLARAPTPTGPWVKEPTNPVLSCGAPTTWDETALINPVVLARAVTGGYIMYYTGYSPGAPWNIAIGVATSTDGVTWTKHTGNPIFERTDATYVGEKDFSIIEQHCVLYLNGWITMLYEGTGDFTYMINIAWSKDFYHFARGETPILEPSGFSGSQFELNRAWDSMMVGQPFLFADDDGTYKLYYYSEGTEIGFPRRIGLAYINPSTLSPNQPPFGSSLQWRVWKDTVIVVAGANSFDVPCTNYKNKTVYLLSDQSGILNIYVDPDKSGIYRAFLLGIVITANTAYSMMTEYGMAYMRLNFVPAVQATVNAYVVTE